MSLLLLLVVPLSVWTSYEEANLYNTLLEDYEPLERPVANGSAPVVVRMGLVLQQIVDVDEKNQLVDVNAWLKLTWHDYSLVWTPEEHGGVTDLRFKLVSLLKHNFSRKSQLWTPDVLMYNSADRQFDSTFASNVLVYPDGTTNWIPPGLFRLSCKIEVVWFPFDVQECFMKFGSWTYDGTKLELEIDENGLDISNYMPNGEWHLVSTASSRNIQYYQCCPEPYYDVVFTFVIRRRVLYYAFNLILPCILITLLTLIGFTLPPDAGEKMSLQITIMLSICIFQNYVAEMSPPTSEAVPFLGAFFAVCMFTCAICVTATAMALNFHNRGSATHEMSYLFRMIMLNWLPWILCMKRPGYIARWGKMYKIQEKHQERSEICTKSLLASILVDSTPNSPRVSRVNEEENEELILPTSAQHLWKHGNHRAGSLKNNRVAPGLIAQLLVLQQIHTNLLGIRSSYDEKERCKQAEDDWKWAAMVVDRFCLFVFSCFIFGATFSLFGAVPNLGQSF